MENLVKVTEKYEKLLEDLRDGEKIIDDVSLNIQAIVSKTINEANATESVDERISTLVSGLQSILNFSNQKKSTFLRDKFVLEAKVSVLNEALDNSLLIVEDSKDTGVE